MILRLIPVAQPVSRFAKQGLAAAVLGLGLVAAMAPQADAEVFVGGCFNCGFRPHFFYPFFGPPVVVGPPPVYYAQPPGAVYAPPASAYVTSGQAISATPVSPPYQASNGLTCREYQSTVVVEGRAQNSYGTACLQPDGSWRIAN
ncbi:MAG: hypothetical protein WAN51_02880 [Alphaproteobacteria bacterium]